MMRNNGRKTHTSEWISSKGLEVVEIEEEKGKLATFTKSARNTWSPILARFINNLFAKIKFGITTSLGWPSLLCQDSKDYGQWADKKRMVRVESGHPNSRVHLYSVRERWWLPFSDPLPPNKMDETQTYNHYHQHIEKPRVNSCKYEEHAKHGLEKNHLEWERIQEI